MRLSELGLGRFQISQAMIELDPELVQKIMARCIVLRCEFMYHNRAFDYTAYSLDFKPPIGDPKSPARVLGYMWEYNSVTGGLKANREESLDGR